MCFLVISFSDFQLLQQDVPEPCEVVEIETCSQAPGDSDSSSKSVSSSSTSRNSNEEGKADANGMSEQT